MPISVVYLQNRHLSPKVRAFVDWAAELFGRCPILGGCDQTCSKAEPEDGDMRQAILGLQAVEAGAY